MICPKCNQTVDDSSIFCSYCGYRIDGNKSPEIKKENITTVDTEIAKETVVTEQSENVEKRDETTESPVVSTIDCEVKREQLKEETTEEKEPHREKKIYFEQKDIKLGGDTESEPSDRYKNTVLTNNERVEKMNNGKYIIFMIAGAVVSLLLLAMIIAFIPKF